MNDAQNIEIGSGPEPQDRGRQASSPTDVPRSGWLDIAHRTVVEAKQDRVTLLAAGVAFFFFLALVPVLLVVVSIYGLLASPEQIRQFASDALAAAPREVRHLVTSQLETIARSSNGRALFGVIVGIVIALWSASTGVSHLVSAVNVAFDEEDRRKTWRRARARTRLDVGGAHLWHRGGPGHRGAPLGTRRQ